MGNEALTPSSGIIGAIFEQAGTLVGAAVVGAKRAAIAVRQMMPRESGPVVERVAEEPGQSGVDQEEADLKTDIAGEAQTPEPPVAVSQMKTGKRGPVVKRIAKKPGQPRGTRKKQI